MKTLPEQAIIDELNKVAFSPEGGLLFNPEKECMDEQLSFLFDTFSQINPGAIIETGTQRCLFDLFILTNFPKTKIYTCDPWEKSIEAVKVMEKYFPSQIEFKNASSKTLLNNFSKDIKIDAAWIDGDHRYEGCYSDLLGCSELKIKNIILDDFRLLPCIKSAIDSFLKSNPYHKKGESGAVDSRGIYWLERSEEK